MTALQPRLMVTDNFNEFHALKAAFFIAPSQSKLFFTESSLNLRRVQSQLGGGHLFGEILYNLFLTCAMYIYIYCAIKKKDIRKLKTNKCTKFHNKSSPCASAADGIRPLRVEVVGQRKLHRFFSVQQDSGRTDRTRAAPC
jgi:hypothetical protein